MTPYCRDWSRVSVVAVATVLFIFLGLWRGVICEHRFCGLSRGVIFGPSLIPVLFGITWQADRPTLILRSACPPPYKTAHFCISLYPPCGGQSRAKRETWWGRKTVFEKPPKRTFRPHQPELVLLSTNNILPVEGIVSEDFSFSSVKSRLCRVWELQIPS